MVTNFHTRKNIVIGFILSILMILFFVVYANRDMRRIEKESGQATNIIQSLALLEAILDDMQDIETGQRGYLLSGENSFLEPFDAAITRLQNDTLKLLEQEKIFPGNKNQLEDILNLVREKLDFSANTISLRRLYPDSAIAMVETQKGIRLMDSIRVKIARLEEENRVLLADENSQRQQAANSTARLFNIISIVFFGLLSLLFWQVYRSIDAMEKYEKKIAYLASLTENTSDAIISTDNKGYIQSWNKAAENIYGYTKEETIGQFGPSITKSGFTEETIENMLKIIREKGIYNQEILQFKKSGQPIQCMVSSSPIYDEGGQVLGFVSVYRDITERKQFEEQLKLFNKELARQVDEKTAKLRQLNEQLTLSNRDLEQFAYVASHDLQEPLRSVKSFLELLEKKYNDQLDDMGRQYIRFAVDGSTRMKELITDLLNFSRVGRRELKMQDVDMNKLVQQVVRSLKPVITESAAIIHAGLLPVVKADELQIELVVQNLVGNAIKYRRAGIIPEVEIGYEVKEDEYEFFVKDNGIGFGQEHWGSIFNIFYRLHTPAEYPGTGIGLAICKKIVELHGGKIWVASEPGKGSIFYFTLLKNA